MSTESEQDINHNLKVKVRKDFPTFTDVVDAMTISDINANLIIYSKYREETLEAQKVDKRLGEIKEEISKASKPYDDKIKEYKSALNKLKKFIDKEISKPALEQTMLEYTKLLEKEERAKKSDDDLRRLKEASTELSKSYSEALSALKLKISYLNVLFEEKSEGLSGESKES